MVSPQGTDHVLNNVKKRSTCVLIPSYILMDRKKKHFYNLHFYGLASRYSINNFTDNGDNQITQINSFLNLHLF